MGRIFHPNQKGHEAIAAFALQNLAMAKARQDGGSSNNVCSYNQDEFHCARADDNRHAFVRWETAGRLHREFCNSDFAPSGEANWRFPRRYNAGTPEAVEFVIQLSNGAFEFNRGQCLESMDLIINSCDGNDPNNPLNLEFGGRYKRGNFQYEVNPLMENREMVTEAGGRCWGDYRFFYSHFDVEGRGLVGQRLWGGISRSS